MFANSISTSPYTILVSEYDNDFNTKIRVNKKLLRLLILEIYVHVSYTHKLNKTFLP